MSKQVSLRTAKLADQKGYDRGGICHAADGTAMPSQTSLQAWLREEHNFCVLVDAGKVVPGTSGFYAKIIRHYPGSVLPFRSVAPLTGGFNIYEKFEDALEEGLYKTLLIV